MIKKQILFFLVLFSINLSYAQNEIIIKFKSNIFQNKTTFNKREYFKKEYQIKEIELISKSLNIWAIKIQDTLQLDNTIKKLRLSPLVDLVQKNEKIFNRANIPNDPDFNLQWQHINQIPGGISTYDMDSDLAWDITTGGSTINGKEIVVCIIDDGLDINQEDLIDNIWINKNEIPNNGIDDDNNGYIDDIYGYNFNQDNNNINGNINNSHGTGVTGIIGAKGDNNIGVSGVNWEVKLMFLVNGRDIIGAIKAYDYALIQKKRYLESNGTEGAYVVATNSSWGIDRAKPEDFPVWCDMYDSLGKYGILNAVATSNSIVDVDLVGDMPSTCPSNYIIATTNINPQGQLNGAYGAEHIDLGAPGSQTYTTLRNNNYGIVGGTSSASPQVAGAVALAYSVDCFNTDELSITHPDSLALLIKDQLLNTTKAISSIENNTKTGGLLNLNNLNNSIFDNCDDLITIRTDDEEINFPNNITIYPNPTNDIININSNTLNIECIRIYNINGQLIKDLKYLNKSDISVDLSELSASIYVIEVIENDLIVTRSKISKI